MPLSDADQELMELQRAHHTTGVSAGQPSGDAIQKDPELITHWEQRRAAQREAHGQFVAAGPIHIGNCLAFDTGHSVPLEHVIRFDLEAQNLVYRVASPELARAGRRFEEAEFLAANPHVDAVTRARVAPEAHPAALDPRGGAAQLDDDRQAAERRAARQSSPKQAARSAGSEA